MGILLFSNVLFSNSSPELSFVDAGIQYGELKKKREKILFVHNKSLI